jgi:hypothetical protein
MCPAIAQRNSAPPVDQPPPADIGSPPRLAGTRRTEKGRGRRATPRTGYHVQGFLRLYEAIRSGDLHLTVVGENPRRRKQRPSTHGYARAALRS